MGAKVPVALALGKRVAVPSKTVPSGKFGPARIDAWCDPAQSDLYLPSWKDRVMTVIRTIRLDENEAAYVDELVASGAYGSEGDVVSAAIRALRDEQRDLERWLEEEVVPVVTRMREEPERAIPAEQVFDEIRSIHRSLTKPRT